MKLFKRKSKKESEIKRIRARCNHEVISKRPGGPHTLIWGDELCFDCGKWMIKQHNKISEYGWLPFPFGGVKLWEHTLMRECSKLHIDWTILYWLDLKGLKLAEWRFRCKHGPFSENLKLCLRCGLEFDLKEIKEIREENWKIIKKKLEQLEEEE
jgi:hypothetical protein